ncbi:MAG: hypothetical protein LQ338_006469 [Usnochroma carphineum]|nr:MAG: hypothetical protein LQ338_006469 [Usnochroma carphineum]
MDLDSLNKAYGTVGLTGTPTLRNNWPPDHLRLPTSTQPTSAHPPSPFQQAYDNHLANPLGLVQGPTLTTLRSRPPADSTSGCRPPHHHIQPFIPPSQNPRPFCQYQPPPFAPRPPLQNPQLFPPTLPPIPSLSSPKPQAYAPPPTTSTSPISLPPQQPTQPNYSTWHPIAVLHTFNLINSIPAMGPTHPMVLELQTHPFLPPQIKFENELRVHALEAWWDRKRKREASEAQLQQQQRGGGEPTIMTQPVQEQEQVPNHPNFIFWKKPPAANVHPDDGPTNAQARMFEHRIQALRQTLADAREKQRQRHSRNTATAGGEEGQEPRTTDVRARAQRMREEQEALKRASGQAGGQRGGKAPAPEYFFTRGRETMRRLMREREARNDGRASAEEPDETGNGGSGTAAELSQDESPWADIGRMWARPAEW